MKKTLLGALVLALIPQIACHGSPFDSAIKENIALVDDMAEVLESVKDAASANAAVPRLQALQERRDALRRRMENMPRSPEQQSRAAQNHQAEMQAALSRMSTQTSRIASIPGGITAIKAMRPSGR